MNIPGTSYPEQFIYWCFKSIYEDTVNRARVLKNRYIGGLELDILIPSERVAIEYSPTRYHKWSVNGGLRDKDKIDVCKEFNVRLINIIEDTYGEYEYYESDNLFIYREDRKRSIEKLIHIVDTILKSLKHSIDEINIEEIKNKAHEYATRRVQDDRYIFNVFPELESEFSSANKIDKLTISFSSHVVVKWQCKKCGYGSNGEWETKVGCRTSYKTSCPKCGWNIFYNKYVKQYPNKLIAGDDFYSNYKNIVDTEWNFNENDKLGVKPYAINKKSHTSVYWICEKCGYGLNGEWKAAIKNRVEQYQGCPKCGWNIWKNDYNKLKKYNYKHNSIIEKHPSLAKEFNKTLNTIDITEVSCGMSKNKIYWTCINCGYGKDGEWLETPNKRTYYVSGCPKCKYNWYWEELRNGY